MSFMTTNIKELREKWMKLYLNVMGLKSHSPHRKEVLQKYQMKFAEFNETAMQFFDDLEK